MIPLSRTHAGTGSPFIQSAGLCCPIKYPELVADSEPYLFSGLQVCRSVENLRNFSTAPFLHPYGHYY